MLGKRTGTGGLFVKILFIGQDNLLQASSAVMVFTLNTPV